MFSLYHPGVLFLVIEFPANSIWKYCFFCGKRDCANMIVYSFWTQSPKVCDVHAGYRPKEPCPVTVCCAGLLIINKLIYTLSLTTPRFVCTKSTD